MRELDIDRDWYDGYLSDADRDALLAELETGKPAAASPALRPVTRLLGYLRGLPTLVRLFWDQIRQLRGQR